MPKSTINGCFFFKASHAQELMEDKTIQPIQVEVVKILQLTYEQYQHFLSHIWADMPFFKDHKRITNCDRKGVNHCLLVTARNIQGGILVDCQGYDYARYAADVPDKSDLDLRDVPIDHYDLKLRQPQSQRER